MNAEDVDEPDHDRPRVKRTKISLACSACRERKTKCDGARPVCSTCQKRGTPEICAYEESYLRTQRYVVELENRIRDLERSNLSLMSQLPIETQTNVRDNIQASTMLGPPPSVPQDLGNTFNDGISFSPVSAVQEVPSTRSRPHEVAAINARKTPPSTDGLATFSPSAEETNLTFGGSSTIAFLRHISGTVNGSRTTQVEPLLASDRVVRVQDDSRTRDQRQITSGIDLSNIVLPSRQLADNFVRAFFRIVHPLFPIIHEPSFRATFTRLWESADAQESDSDTGILQNITFLSTVNVVFALGCQFSDLVQPERRTSLAVEFYHRSVNLSGLDTLDAASIESVQLLLLTGIYLQSTQHASRCWNVVGLAIRAAEALGLHLESRHRHAPHQLGREIGRRVWYNCVLLDRLQAMTFGRPTMIPHPSSVQLPLAVDDEDLRADNGADLPDSTESRMSFFLASIALFDILEDILISVYSSETDNQKEGNDNTRRHLPNVYDLMKLNSRLDQFLNNLPKHLQVHNSQYPPAGTKHECFTLQTNVLHCRFLYTRTLLLRPLLLSTSGSLAQREQFVNGTTLEQQAVARGCLLCVDSARQLVDSLHQNLYSIFRNSGWYTVYFTFAAATVLICARLSSIPDMNLSDDDFQFSWSRIIAILEYHKSQIHSANKGIQHLEGLKRRVEEKLARMSQDALASDVDIWYTIPTSFGFEDFENLSTSWFTQPFTNLDFFETL